MSGASGINGLFQNPLNRLGGHARGVEASVQRLSSGRRVNRAGDDAAASSMISKMSASVRSHAQTQRNIQQGISLLQTAEGALGEINQSLQRLQELIVQAGNGSHSADAQQAIQNEIDAILEGIDGIANVTEYNGTKLIMAQGGDDFDKIIAGLKSSWMEKAEDLIQAHYGLTADGADLTIEVHSLDGKSGVLAYVSGYPESGTGKYSGQEMHIDLDDFTPGDLPNGGSGPMYNDRIIAHEMVHAVMGRTMNYASLPKWFKEGTAEFIHGADERLSGDIAVNGGGATGRAAVVNAIDSWSGSSLDYSAGYAAVKYLHNNVPGGVAAVMGHLSANAGSTLDDAFAALGLVSEANFIAKFKVSGAAFIGGLDLTNADTGSIGGSDEGGPTPLNAEDVVPDINNSTDDPTVGFNEIWPDGNSDWVLQVGIHSDANSRFALGSYLPDARASALGLQGLDVVNDAAGAFAKLELALNSLGLHRAKVGSAINALGFAYNNNQSLSTNLVASKAAIEDADMATESSRLTRNQILVKASMAMLGQANQAESTMLALIENV